MSSNRRQEWSRSDNQKRKRAHGASQTHCPRSFPVKTQRKQARTDFSFATPAIGLQSLGHEADDVLQSFYEYIELPMDQALNSTIEDRFPDTFVLDKLLRPAFRHLCASFPDGRDNIMTSTSRTSHQSQRKPSELPAQTTDASNSLHRLPPSLPLLVDRGLQSFEGNGHVNITAYQDQPEEHHHVENLSPPDRRYDAFLGVDEVDLYTPSTTRTIDSHTIVPAPLQGDLGPHPFAVLLGDTPSGLQDLRYNQREDFESDFRNGTINPSLLGLSRLESPSRTPSLPLEPYSPPQSMSSIEYIPHGSAVKSEERAHNNGKRTTETEMRREVPIPSFTATGKRNRKLSAKARETLEVVEEPSSKIAPFAKKAHRTNSSVEYQLKPELPKQQLSKHGHSFCHQCRRSNLYEKMQCCVIKESGARCTLLFCENCIIKR
jgi:hypothetical protein